MAWGHTPNAALGDNRPYAPFEITERMVLEILEHEGIVREAYRDSVGVWTWGVGVTDASGHKVMRYVDNPQSIERVLEVYVWLLRTKYMPSVEAAFRGFDLKEHEVAAALSFHYNTGAIRRATWVETFRKGDRPKAVAQIMNWASPPEIIGRRKCEQMLFDKGIWTSDGLVPVYSVTKPSYRPSKGKLVDVRAELRRVLMDS